MARQEGADYNPGGSNTLDTEGRRGSRHLAPAAQRQLDSSCTSWQPVQWPICRDQGEDQCRASSVRSARQCWLLSLSLSFVAEVTGSKSFGVKSHPLWLSHSACHIFFSRQDIIRSKAVNLLRSGGGSTTQLCHCLACQCSAYDELQFQNCSMASSNRSGWRVACRQLVSICRPELLEPHLFPASAPGGLPITAGGDPSRKVRRRSWASSEYLAQRLHKFSAYLKVSQMHVSCIIRRASMLQQYSAQGLEQHFRGRHQAYLHCQPSGTIMVHW